MLVFLLGYGNKLMGKINFANRVVLYKKSRIVNSKTGVVESSVTRKKRTAHQADAKARKFFRAAEESLTLLFGFPILCMFVCVF